jgi:hypothetical protein
MQHTDNGGAGQPPQGREKTFDQLRPSLVALGRGDQHVLEGGARPLRQQFEQSVGLCQAAVRPQVAEQRFEPCRRQVRGDFSVQDVDAQSVGERHQCVRHLLLRAVPSGGDEGLGIFR